MIDHGEFVVLLGDQRLFIQIEDGRLTGIWTTNDLAVVSHDAAEIGAAIARLDGAPMFVRGDSGARPRVLSAHERMWVRKELRITGIPARIDVDNATRTLE